MRGAKRIEHDRQVEVATAAAAAAAGKACGIDERARGWPCNALAPEKCRSELERNHWVNGYVAGWNQAPTSVLPLRV